MNQSTLVKLPIDGASQACQMLDSGSYNTIHAHLGADGFNSTSYMVPKSDKQHFVHQQVPQ